MYAFDQSCLLDWLFYILECFEVAKDIEHKNAIATETISTTKDILSPAHKQKYDNIKGDIKVEQLIIEQHRNWPKQELNMQFWTDFTTQYEHKQTY